MSIKLFICYARKDETLLNKLKSHLSPLRRQGFIQMWHDRNISAGSEWEEEIKDQLNGAEIVLLLVSPDFMNSDYINDVELKRAIERHNRGEAHVIPIILRPVYWLEAPFGKLQALPTYAKPVVSSSWRNSDEAFFNVTEGILKVVQELDSRSVVKPAIKKSSRHPWEKYILIADDDEALTEFITVALADEGYNIVTAVTGEEALLIAQVRQFDLILLDVSFLDKDNKEAGMQGYDILSSLREKGINVPIIMVTGGRSGHSYKRAFNRGVVDYIAKPFDLAELIARVKARIEQ